jgi:hypothetical protein
MNNIIQNNLNSENSQQLIKSIRFKVKYDNDVTFVTIQSEKLTKWRQVSEYLDTILNSFHENSIIEIDMQNVIDLFGLMIVFNFFETNKLSRVASHQKQSIFNCLCYFGVSKDILQCIKKGYGLVFQLTNIDCLTEYLEDELKKHISNSEIDKELLLTQQRYNKENASYSLDYSNVVQKYVHLICQ